MRPIAPLLVLILVTSACSARQAPIEMPTPNPPKRTAPSDWPLLSPWSLAQARQPAPLADPQPTVCPAESLARG